MSQVGDFPRLTYLLYGLLQGLVVWMIPRERYSVEQQLPIAIRKEHAPVIDHIGNRKRHLVSEADVGCRGGSSCAGRGATG